MSKKRVTVSLRTPPPSEAPPAPESTPSSIPSTIPPPSAVIEAPALRTRVGDRREVVVYLPVDLARRLYLRCVERGCDPSALVAEALRQALADPEQREEREVTLPAELWRRARAWLGDLWTHLPAAVRRRISRAMPGATDRAAPSPERDGIGLAPADVV